MPFGSLPHKEKGRIIMAYERHEWQCGESITAEKLNHMEEGIADAGSGGVLTP